MRRKLELTSLPDRRPQALKDNAVSFPSAERWLNNIVIHRRMLDPLGVVHNIVLDHREKRAANKDDKDDLPIKRQLW